MIPALHIATPLLASNAFGAGAGRQVWLKMDALQPSGSFKLRGIGHACMVHAARGARRIVSSSGGNAGLAAAYAARRLGLPALVVVPDTTSARAPYWRGKGPRSWCRACPSRKRTRTHSRCWAWATLSSIPSTTRCCGKATRA